MCILHRNPTPLLAPRHHRWRGSIHPLRQNPSHHFHSAREGRQPSPISATRNLCLKVLSLFVRGSWIVSSIQEMCISIVSHRNFANTKIEKYFSKASLRLTLCL